MLEVISNKLAKQLESSEKDNKERIYAYGLEIIISTGAGFLCILLSAFLMRVPALGVIFILVFSPLRMFVGGYHAQTYKKCFFISVSSFLILLFISKKIGNTILLLPVIFIFLCACCYILSKRPVINKRQEISVQKQNRNIKIARMILEIDILGVIFLSGISKELMCMAALSIILVAVFILIVEI